MESVNAFPSSIVYFVRILYMYFKPTRYVKTPKEELPLPPAPEYKKMNGKGLGELIENLKKINLKEDKNKKITF